MITRILLIVVMYAMMDISLSRDSSSLLDQVSIDVDPCAEDSQCPCEADIHSLTYMNTHMLRRIQKLECCCKELRKVPMIAKNCAELYKMGYTTNGIYYLVNPELSLSKNPFSVYCDMEKDGGGWTVFQNRFDGSVDFYRNWNDYKEGFGSLTGEHWLGLDYVWAITNGDLNTLHVYLEDFDGKNKYAKYEDFHIESEANKYKFHVGAFSGTLANHFSELNGVAFTTKDVDNDSYSKNCAVMFNGAFWFTACHKGHLNGLYSTTNPVPFAQGIIWKGWKAYYHSFKKSTLKMRPVNF